MIVTVTPNLALDVTYELDALRLGESHRVRTVTARAGGKGVNVARVLHALGHDVLVLGPAGGATGDAVRADLEAAGIPHALTPISGETRRTLTAVAGGEATVLNEPGPRLSPAEWSALAASIPRRDVLVLSGSLPPGVPPEALAELADARTIVDTTGEALRLAAPRAWAVKPNAEELAALTGTSDPVEGARLLGARTVVVSLGADGLMAVSGDAVCRVAAPEVVSGNPTGAGDAVVAALAAGLAHARGAVVTAPVAGDAVVTGLGTPWPELLQDAAALSAAAVLSPVAGSYDAAAYERFRHAPRLAR